MNQESKYEVVQTHLVTTFSTSYIDDNVAVRKFGKGLGNNGLATSECPGNSCGSTLHASYTDVNSTTDLVTSTLTGKERQEYADQ